MAFSGNASVVASHAALRLLSSATYQTGFAAGAVSAPDAGGGTYTYVAANTSGCLFTGTVSGSTLTVATVTNGAIKVGFSVNVGSTGVPIGTIVSFGSGSGGTGTYTLSASATISPAVSFTADDDASFLVAADGGRWFNVGFYRQTAAELALSVTPTNYLYPADPYVDPRRYGADPTGTTDSTTAFQTACNVAFQANGTVIVGQACNFLIGASGTGISKTFGGNHTNNALRIIGASLVGSRLTLNTSSPPSSLLTIQGSTPTGLPIESQFVMENLTLSGTTGSNGITLIGVAFWELKNVNIDGFEKNLYLYSSLTGSVHNCGLFGGTYGMYARTDGTGSPSNLIRVRDSVINGNTTWGIDYDGGSHLILDGCDIEQNGHVSNFATGGVHIGANICNTLGVAVIRISGCWFEGNNGQTIQVDDPGTGSGGQWTLSIRDTFTLAEDAGNAIKVAGGNNCFVEINSCTSATAGATWDITATNVSLCNVLAYTLTVSATNKSYINVSTSGGAVFAPQVAAPYVYKGSTAGTASGSAVTAQTLPSAAAAVYLVSAAIASVNDSAHYSSVAVVSVNGTAASIAALQSGSSLTISLSGRSVQLTQSSGATQVMQYSMMLVG